MSSFYLPLGSWCLLTSGSGLNSVNRVTKRLIPTSPSLLFFPEIIRLAASINGEPSFEFSPLVSVLQVPEPFSYRKTAATEKPGPMLVDREWRGISRVAYRAATCPGPEGM
ncbi:hypothetical protein GOBAR_DD15859 [Gossypium barbadense]|nr:hypothetical protein GOBAR_DD15859 [Gossypium barbadense]